MPVIVYPHADSTHFAGKVRFSGRAIDPEEGSVPSSVLQWEITRDGTGAVVGSGQGASLEFEILEKGDYTATLSAQDSTGKTGTERVPFHVGDTVAEIKKPDNQGFVGIGVFKAYGFGGLGGRA